MTSLSRMLLEKNCICIFFILFLSKIAAANTPPINRNASTTLVTKQLSMKTHLQKRLFYGHRKKTTAPVKCI